MPFSLPRTKFLRWRKSYTFLHSVPVIPPYFYIGYCNVFENVIVTGDGENFIADYKLAIWYSDDASITKEEPRPSLNYRLKNSTRRILLKNTARCCNENLLILLFARYFYNLKYKKILFKIH